MYIIHLLQFVQVEFHNNAAFFEGATFKKCFYSILQHFFPNALDERFHADTLSFHFAIGYHKPWRNPLHSHFWPGGHVREQCLNLGGYESWRQLSTSMFEYSSWMAGARKSRLGSNESSSFVDYETPMISLIMLIFSCIITGCNDGYLAGSHQPPPF